jgi:hypothetical protein
MRSALPILAASAGLLLAATAYAGSGSKAAAGGDTGASTSSSSTSDPSTSPDASTPPGASSATGAGANTSATAGDFHVGETVVDNTGATIGQITSLSTVGGQQMAVIKMGDQSFQAPTDRLGSSNGQATINMSKAQLSSMIKGANPGSASPGAGSTGATPPPKSGGM